MTMTRMLTSALIVIAPTVALAQSEPPVLTRDNGAPTGDNRNSKTAGEDGGVLLEDVQLIEKLARFDRERVPERVVHARGTGAHGEFVASDDLSDLTTAAPFRTGKKTPVFVRFSTVIHPNGSPEGLRDPRGFATKFYTDQGNWDLVGNNLPVFFIRDAKQFPDMVHSLKPSPVSNKQDPNRFFDFFSHTPESVHMLTQVYSDLGTPASYREMDGHGVHAYKFVNAKGDVSFVKFHWKSRQGVKTLNAAQAAAAHFNYATDDLYAAIGAGNFPVWDLYVKILRPADFAKLDYNPFDATKDWYGIPERKVGTMTLNRLPGNFFQDTEQSAFAPSNLIPGIEPSPDRLLQGRLFSYADTQRHRIGGNVNQLPINAPRVAVTNNNQDGYASAAPRQGDVNYFPSNAAPRAAPAAGSDYTVSGLAQAKPISLTNNFAQAGLFFKSLPAQAQANLISNLAGDLGKVENMAVRTRVVSYFVQADREYGMRLAKAVKVDLGAVQSEIENQASTAGTGSIASK